ncbi:MAG TPA: ATP-binding protein, partial [Microbacteriaceae bacterium]|nr:ATP-binding protein [Microbacteriaceae bacterium]
AARDGAADRRDVSAEVRDQAAELRDRGAEGRDDVARRSQRLSDLTDQSRNARGKQAGRDRVSAAGDRGDSASDRGDSAGDRDEAAGDRTEAAHEREGARLDRKYAELAAQRALETLESMSDAFLTLDSDWCFTYLNPQTESILDRRRDELLGKSMWEEFPEAVGSAFEIGYRQAMSERVPVRFESYYEPLDRTLEIRAHPIPDGLAVYFSDVTQERLREAHHRQTQRLEALGQITAGVAHDFSNLVLAIAGYAELGQRKFASEAKDRRYFDEIHQASQKAAALTRQLLTFAHEQTLSPTLIDLNDAVRGLASVLGQLLPSTVRIGYDLAAEPVFVFVDHSQLEQVLINLVVNSRDATNGTGLITVGTAVTDTGGLTSDVPSGWLRVTDDGCGIPEDLIPRIFEPYFSTKPRETSTGLGLATIFGIVSQSGGSIFVDSTVGLGTTITIAIPQTEVAPPTSYPAPRAAVRNRALTATR